MKKALNAPKKMGVHSGDTVVVITGKEKGKQGKITRAYPKTGRVIVEGVAMVSRHQKPRGAGMPGGIIHKEAAIDASNVMLLCQKCGKATRLAHKIMNDGTKVRVCKKCDAAFEN